MKNPKGQFITDNRGAALITVMVVTVFISVLASTVLYFTSMNYQMKSTDYQNTKSFYKAEETLDALKSVLIKDVSEACEAAYKEVMSNYASYGAEQRKQIFAHAYVDKLSEIWTDRVSSGTYVDAIKALLTTEGIDSAVVDCILNDAADDMSVDATNRDEGQFIIKNVKVMYVQNGFSSYISTDIGLMPPEFDVTYDNSTSLGTPEERKIVNMGDYVIYMNWQRY